MSGRDPSTELFLTLAGCSSVPPAPLLYSRFYYSTSHCTALLLVYAQLDFSTRFLQGKNGIGHP